MEYATTRFGPVSVAPENIINFPRGLPGFNGLRKFFFYPVAENKHFIWLQATEAAEVAFLLTDPFLFRPDYTIRLAHNERQLLKVSQPDEVSVYVIVRIPPTGKAECISANFLAPLVVNSQERLGCQLVLENTSYMIREPLFKPTPNEEQAKGADTCLF
ncbi:MAG: flagellar assembly protein FliW [Firmicutes bacterium]|nr:flagellar assembly protein FliW [Bacillota bacterium]